MPVYSALLFWPGRIKGMDTKLKKQAPVTTDTTGAFITMMGERFYVIRDVDELRPFLISVVSSDDHWLFVSSSGGLTAGRESPEKSLFPYITADKIHESTSHTGSKTMIRIDTNGEQRMWEPFSEALYCQQSISRNLYKSLVANKLCFEEINHDLQLLFRYTWETSDRFGFVRRCELQNLANEPVNLELVDGLQNILPAGTSTHIQTNTSNLVNAYKWTELDEGTGLAIYNLYSGITDRAEPCESLRANTVFCLGLEGQTTLISSNQLGDFRCGKKLVQETHTRGIRGAYFASQRMELPPKASRKWLMVADVEMTQSQVIELRHQLMNKREITAAISKSVQQGTDELSRLMAAGDAFQATAEETVSTHHYANVLFNSMRGGILDDQYRISVQDFVKNVRHFNYGTFKRNEVFLKDLPDRIDVNRLLEAIIKSGDVQLERLCREYLPITFGRRHGDPSRPWNKFHIKLKDSNRNRLLFYEGNWRDIFQNWEALAFSYPEFTESMIAKFVNASTLEGYNPYRISKEGIDWEVEDPADPWAYIGYWGDHQIIYLSKLLELSTRFHPSRLRNLLNRPVFNYANVPYRIKPFDSLLENAKSTVSYDHDLAARIEQRVTSMGVDGKLVLDACGEVYQVTLLEKLLVPLLCKLCNLVVDGGIWMNTQRPEWNDANNALVGHGLSMVTLYYMRRHISLMQQILSEEEGETELSNEVSEWLVDTASALKAIAPLLSGGAVSPAQRLTTLRALGEAASKYQAAVYQDEPFSGKSLQKLDVINGLFKNALTVIDHSISTNRRDDGLYHAYNLLEPQQDGIVVKRLYLMLEGQVAALSSGFVGPEEACTVLERLFDSEVYRQDQHSFMLYPDRQLPGFFEKNRVSASDVKAIPLLNRMIAANDERILERDIEGGYHFNASFRNVNDLDDQLVSVSAQYGDDLSSARAPLRALFEKVFGHQEFTGRSGTMFGFEGLGCIYWHMVSKLLLAVQEVFFKALETDADQATCHRLGGFYYRVAAGLCFNKTPSEYGAFPTDPYSHTPRHAGARQPGMTGQVKEEILSRFGELGVRVNNGAVQFSPCLLREREFTATPRNFRFLDVNGEWQDLQVPVAGLAFTWCQVPVIYQLDDEAEPSLTITLESGEQQTLPHLSLPSSESAELFQRSGRIRQLKLVFSTALLFTDSPTGKN